MVERAALTVAIFILGARAATVVLATSLAPASYHDSWEGCVEVKGAVQTWGRI